LDVGEPEKLAAALREVRARTRGIVWLNPLLGTEGYQPLARGMSAALPHLDVFAPAHNMESLLALERLIMI
ncbi:MAG: VWA domain-containing protein, partial [SAR324 cluster bacterium]|nr:VWA domain-containing protein [SAR324 cluster bacterium]